MINNPNVVSSGGGGNNQFVITVGPMLGTVVQEFPTGSEQTAMFDMGGPTMGNEWVSVCDADGNYYDCNYGMNSMSGRVEMFATFTVPDTAVKVEVEYGPR